LLDWFDKNIDTLETHLHNAVSIDEDSDGFTVKLPRQVLERVQSHLVRRQHQLRCKIELISKLVLKSCKDTLYELIN
jgi:hypothetical protein